MPNDYELVRDARKPKITMGQGMRRVPTPNSTPSKVEAENAPGGAVVQIPVPRSETENKLSGTESKVGKYSDKIRMAPFTGTKFHEQETKETKI